MFKYFIIIASALSVSACTSDQINNSLNTGTNLLKHAEIIPGTTLTSTQVSEGLKQALTLSMMNVTKGLGQEGGFANNSNVRIPLPQNLQSAKNMLTMAGYGAQVAEVEAKMNQAAEASMPLVKDQFIAAIKSMSITDALGIVKGHNSAATEYFYTKMAPSLKDDITPIVQNKLQEVAALQTYTSLIEAYQNMPLLAAIAPDIEGNLINQTIDHTLKGIFTYLAKEEEQIRTNPAARTTALLQKVFALQSN